MKKSIIISLLALGMIVPVMKNVYGVFLKTKIPISKGDTDEYFEALGIAYGSKVRMGELHILALANAQNLIRQKMAHFYNGVIEDYMVTYGNNVGTDIETKMERRGKQIVNFISNDTREVGAPEFSGIDEKGNVTCYVLARVYKKGLPEKIVDFILKSEELKDEIVGEGLQKIIDKHLKVQ